MRTRKRMKGVYVVKSEEDKVHEYEPRKKTESRGVYVLRTSEEVVNKFADIVYDFVDDGGVFLLVGSDKIFYQTLKRTMVYELGVESEFVQTLHTPGRALDAVIVLRKENLTPFVFLEYLTEGQSNLPALKAIKADYPEVPVVVVAHELNKERILQLYEEGADHVLGQSLSVNEIIRKVVHIIKPQTEIDELVKGGRQLLDERRYEDAIRVANTIFQKRPDSARAHLIMGDAFKGMAQREQALASYKKAEENSDMFLEPLKRIFFMHAEEGDKLGMLEYLVKLDDLSPLNFNRKIRIADLNYDIGQVDEAERYYDTAIKSAATEARSIVGEMSIDIADKLTDSNPELAAKYYAKSLEVIKDSRDFSCMTTFNRLGISLRKAGLWKEAVEAYEAAEKISPGDENIQYNLGLAYHQGSDYKAAVTSMLKALRINPKMYMGNAEVAYNMGAVFKDGGERNHATRLIRHVFEIDPNHDGARALDLI